MAAMSGLVAELEQLVAILSASKLVKLPGRSGATAALLNAARCLGWHDDTCPIIAQVCCPEHPPHLQVWLSGPRYGAVLVWAGVEFHLHSCTLLGQLVFYPRSPRGTGLPAISLGSGPAEDCPVRASRFKQLLRGADVPLAHRVTILAGFCALHEVFRLPQLP